MSNAEVIQGLYEGLWSPPDILALARGGAIEPSGSGGMRSSVRCVAPRRPGTLNGRPSALRTVETAQQVRRIECQNGSAPQRRNRRWRVTDAGGVYATASAAP